MTIPADDAPVVDDTAASRFLITRGRRRGRAHLRPARATGCPRPHRGARGVGRARHRESPGPRRPGQGRGQRLTVVPWCPYARRWLQEHPDEAAAVKIDWETHPTSPRGRVRPLRALRREFPRCSPWGRTWHFRPRGRSRVSATPQDEADEVDNVGAGPTPIPTSTSTARKRTRSPPLTPTPTGPARPNATDAPLGLFQFAYRPFPPATTPEEASTDGR